MGGKEPEDETKTTNDRSMLSGPTNDSIPAGQVQAKRHGESEVARSILRLLCVSFVVAASEREGEILWDTSGWLGANGKGTFWVGIP